MAELLDSNSLKILADALHRLHRRSVVGAHRHRVGLADLFQLRHEHVENDGQPQPEQQHRHRDQAQHVREPRLREGVIFEFLGLHVRGAHSRPCPESAAASTRLSLTVAFFFLIISAI